MKTEVQSMKGFRWLYILYCIIVSFVSSLVVLMELWNFQTWRGFRLAECVLLGLGVIVGWQLYPMWRNIISHFSLFISGK